MDKNDLTAALTEDLKRHRVGFRKADVETFIDRRWDQLAYAPDVLQGGRLTEACLVYIRHMVKRRRALFVLWYSLAFTGLGAAFTFFAVLLQAGLFSGLSGGGRADVAVLEALWQVSITMGPGFLLMGVIGVLYALVVLAWLALRPPEPPDPWDGAR